MSTYYDILDVSRNAPPNEITEAYKRKSREGPYRHPDKGGTNEMFNILKNAYQELIDKNKRLSYDSHLDCSTGFGSIDILAEMKSKIDWLNKQANSMESETTKIIQVSRMRENEEKMKAKEEHIRKLQKENTEKDQIIIELQASNNKQDERIRQNEEKNGQLRNENEQLCSENGQLRSENGQLRNENGKLHDEIAQLCIQHQNQLTEHEEYKRQHEYSGMFGYILSGSNQKKNQSQFTKSFQELLENNSQPIKPL